MANLSWTFLVAAISSSYLLFLLSLLSFSFPHPLAASAAQIGSSETSPVGSWIEWILKGVGTSTNALGKYLGGTKVIYVARMGPMDEGLGNGQLSWGYVPWSTEYPGKYRDIDGMYEIISDTHNIFQKNTHYNDDTEATTTEEEEEEEEEGEEEEKYLFIFDKQNFRFEARKGGNLLESRPVVVFGSSGNFDEAECEKGALQVVWDKASQTEIARLMCVRHVKWMSSLAPVDLCKRYASGMVKTVRGFYNSFELVGERDVLHKGKCSMRELQFAQNIRSIGKMPFNIHIHISHGYIPNAAYTAYSIAGEYELDMNMGKSYWARKSFSEHGGLRFFFDYYWDRLVIVDAETQAVVKRYYVPENNPLIWSKCRRGLSSSLWDKEESREVGRIWCGDRSPRSDDSHSQPMCCQYPSGRMESFDNVEGILLAEQFFPTLRIVHSNYCTMEELGAIHNPVVVGGGQILLVIIASLACCTGVCAIIIVTAFWCCYDNVVPVSRRRAAGFKRVGVSTSSSLPEDEVLPEAVSVGKPSERGEWAQNVAISSRGNPQNGRPVKGDQIALPGIVVRETSPRSGDGAYPRASAIGGYFPSDDDFSVPVRRHSSVGMDQQMNANDS